MALSFDPQTGEISYLGRVVGRREFNDGISRVSFHFSYECGPDEDWQAPVSWLAYGLALLPQNQSLILPADLTLETAKEEIAEEFERRRTLLEKLVKRDGYIWAFHKTDVDDWPSTLHGHDHDKRLKLDVFTGGIYDTGTRQLCKALTKKELNEGSK